MSRRCRYNSRREAGRRSTPRFRASLTKSSTASGWDWVIAQGIEATSTQVAPSGGFTGLHRSGETRIFPDDGITTVVKAAGPRRHGHASALGGGGNPAAVRVLAPLLGLAGLAAVYGMPRWRPWGAPAALAGLAVSLIALALTAVAARASRDSQPHAPAS